MLRASKRAGDRGGKRRVTLAGDAFIRRFLPHVLPRGIQRIRHCGVLANGTGARRLSWLGRGKP